LEPGESGGEVAAAVELADDVDGVVAEGAVNGAVALLVSADKIGPAMVDDLPKRRGAGAARAVDGWHRYVFGRTFIMQINFVSIIKPGVPPSRDKRHPPRGRH
jgi:hypothetical protein